MLFDADVLAAFICGALLLCSVSHSRCTTNCFYGTMFVLQTSITLCIFLLTHDCSRSDNNSKRQVLGTNELNPCINSEKSTKPPAIFVIDDS